MKKSLLFTILLVVTGSNAFTQNTMIIKRYVDSLKHELAIAKQDTTRVLIIAELAFQFSAPDFDSCSAYSKQGLALAKQIHFLRGEVRVLDALASGLAVQGDLPKSLELLFRGLQIAEENHFPFETAICLTHICADYWSLKDYLKATSYGKRAKQVYSNLPEDRNLSYHLKNLIDISIGLSYSDMNQLDSAMVYLDKVYKDTSDLLFQPVVLFILGDVYFKLGNHQKAFKYLYQSIEISEKTNDYYTDADACKIISMFFSQMNQTDSAIFYAKKGLASSQAIGYKLGVFENSKLLANLYETKDLNESHFYLKMVMAENDELYGAKKVQELQKTIAVEQERQRQIDAQKIAFENKIKQYGFLAALGIMFFVAFFLYRNNRQKQKANSLLAQQKQKVESTLTELKSAQAQLIQSEKMASLGELTAGIAHEIQNPLNFVNNFSEVSTELLDEMKKEFLTGNQQLATEIADDVQQNLEKILLHGKRADAIVKGMLQHSQSSSGVKEPTNINTLADEYLRLSYHGMRAKDKFFNAIIQTDFDETIGKINIIPQDIGRVLLNLYNNAFYASAAKAQATAGSAAKAFAKADSPSSLRQAQGSASNLYEPVVTLSTKRIGDKPGSYRVEIRVKDNGNGTPENIIDKIFQPFFTTKPTGQGTGLGLSLAYDIVKAHGGEIKVVTKEGEGLSAVALAEVGSEFIIQLPIV